MFNLLTGHVLLYYYHQIVFEEGLPVSCELELHSCLPQWSRSYFTETYLSFLVCVQG